MASKKLDAKLAKEKKQKKIAAVGAVLLVAVLGVQVPRTMKMLNGSDDIIDPAAAAAASQSTATATTPAPAAGGDEPLAPPTLSGENPTAPAAGAPAAAPAAVSTQLVSFSTFAPKDPFAPQVAKGVGGSAPADAPPEDETGPPAAESGPGTDDGDGAEPGGTAAPPGRAVLRVNGAEETVAVAAAFPATGPAFVLVAVAKGSATIGVAEGGSFAAGGGTLKLAKGEAVTLVNTADGTRYVVELVSVG